MTNKHTQGKWEVGILGDVAHKYEGNVDSYQMTIATIHDTAETLGKPNIANATLIAAAPELLEMLEEVLYYVEESDEVHKPTHKVAPKVIALIKKAKGEL